MCNNLEELNIWIESIKSLPIDDDNIDIFHNFMRFSPEKFADKINMHRETLVKEFDKHKKEIHNKINTHKKIKELKKRKIKVSTFFYQGELVTSRLCYCISKFKIKSISFYPTIKYLYFYNDEQLILLPDEHRRVMISNMEFNAHFIDNREQIINNILK